MVIEGGNDPQSGYLSAKKLLDMPERPTAIFTNDITAVGVIRAVKEHNLRVPEDVSVVGFDDIDAALYLEPNLTTVSVQKTEMGKLAAQKIIQMIKGQDAPAPNKVLLPTHLVIRDSTARCSALKG